LLAVTLKVSAVLPPWSVPKPAKVRSGMPTPALLVSEEAAVHRMLEVA
jgi:hypothetical protein